jgi:hypothetical protein
MYQIDEQDHAVPSVEGHEDLAQGKEEQDHEVPGREGHEDIA